MTASLRPGLLALLLSLLTACPERPAASPALVLAPDGGLPPSVAALVNGRPIEHFEVVLRLRSLPEATPQQALEDIVLDELRAQRAAELGLEKDPAFLAELARVEAQVAEAKRRELSKLFVHREVLAKADPSDAEVQAYVDRHRPRFSSKVKVLQLLRRDRPGIDAVKAALDGGARFEELVVLGGGAAPLTLADATIGPLRWDELPSGWGPALDGLQPGEVTDIIAPVRLGSFAMLKLLEREPAPTPTFDEVAPLVRATLKAERQEALKASTDEALRKVGRVVFGELLPKR